jgi:acetyltransferase-like isoleucine patch superfamily enzyme
VFEQLKLKTKEQGFECSPVVIGDNCWIGSNVIILKGVSIGNNSVIGAGTVIAKNIPPNSVVIDRQDLVIKSRAVVEGNQ